MDSALWGFVGVVIGGLITGGITLLAERQRQRSEAALDSIERHDDRQLALDELQRQTLTKLQAAANERARLEFANTPQESAAWALNVDTLTSRVVDSEARRLATEMQDASGDGAILASMRFVERAGELIRATYRL